MDEAFGIAMEELERTGQAEDYFQVKSAAAIRENPRAQHLATRSTTTYLQTKPSPLVAFRNLSRLALLIGRATTLEIKNHSVRHHGCLIFPILVSNLPSTQFTLAVNKTTGGAS
jgi:hypothetical protein